MRYSLVVTYVNDILSQYTIKLTLRQIHYRLVAGYGYPNTNSAYTHLSKHLVKARKRGDIDETRIEDRSREFLGGDYPFDNLEDFVTYRFETFLDSPNQYARKLWSSQPEHVIVFVEKDALSRVISMVADRKYNVTTCPSRGYASYTYIKEALARLPEGKQTTILHFADHDPSGLDMTRDLENRFSEYSDLDITIDRIALNYDQVQRYELPSNPTKKDPRAKGYIAEYGNECWELDAIEPEELQRMVSAAIEQHIDFDIWFQTWEEIQEEREELTTTFSSIRNLLREHEYYAP